MGFPNVDIARTEKGKSFLSRVDKTTGNDNYFNSGVDPGVPYREAGGITGLLTV
mgnify:FL=1